MKDERDATKLVKAILENSNINYVELSKKLENIGIKEDNVNLSNKINRGSFSVVFLLQITDVLGLEIQIQHKSTKDGTFISKEEFIEKFIEINKLTWKTENGEIYAVLTKARERLFEKAGFFPEIHSDFVNSDYGDATDSDATEDVVAQLYDELSKDNEILNDAKDLIKRLD